MSQTLEKILEEVKALNAEERHYLMTVLGGSDSGSALSGEDEFQRRLAAEGWLSLPLPPSDEYQQSAPAVELSGRPLSEILIEERR